MSDKFMIYSQDLALCLISQHQSCTLTLTLIRQNAVNQINIYPILSVIIFSTNGMKLNLIILNTN